MRRSHRRFFFWVGVAGLGGIVTPAIAEAAAMKWPGTPFARFIAYSHGNTAPASTRKAS